MRKSRTWQDTGGVLELFFDTVFTARRYYRSFAKKGIDQGRREDLNGERLIRSFCVTTDRITAIAAKLENIETVKLKGVP